MKRADIAAGIIILLVSAIMYASLQRFLGKSFTRYGPDVFPQFLTIVWSILAILLIVNALRGKFIKGSEKFTFVEVKRVLIVVVTIVASLVLMNYIGFLFSMVIFLFVSMSYFGEKRLIPKICLSIGIGVSIFLIFRYVMVIPLPEFRLF